MQDQSLGEKALNPTKVGRLKKKMIFLFSRLTGYDRHLWSAEENTSKT